MKLSVIIPAYNEVESLSKSIPSIFSALKEKNIVHEIMVINDGSTDNTLHLLKELSGKYDSLKYINNDGPKGFGFAVRKGLESFNGDCVAIMMADLSDSPSDLIKFYFEMMEGDYDCVFGSRFIKGGKVSNYPKLKLILNRLANNLIRLVFRLKYNDFTNAFKLYKRQTIDGLKPFLSPHFNLTLELPLKAIVRGYSYTVLPNQWTNRKFGKSNLSIREMGSRYFFIMLYCLIEKYFSKGDFKKKWD